MIFLLIQLYSSFLKFLQKFHVSLGKNRKLNQIMVRTTRFKHDKLFLQLTKLPKIFKLSLKNTGTRGNYNC